MTGKPTASATGAPCSPARSFAALRMTRDADVFISDTSRAAASRLDMTDAPRMAFSGSVWAVTPYRDRTRRFVLVPLVCRTECRSTFLWSHASAPSCAHSHCRQRGGVWCCRGEGGPDVLSQQGRLGNFPMWLLRRTGLPAPHSRRRFRVAQAELAQGRGQRAVTAGHRSDARIIHLAGGQGGTGRTMGRVIGRGVRKFLTFGDGKISQFPRFILWTGVWRPDILVAL